MKLRLTKKFKNKNNLLNYKVKANYKTNNEHLRMNIKIKKCDINNELSIKIKIKNNLLNYKVKANYKANNEHLKMNNNNLRPIRSKTY